MDTAENMSFRLSDVAETSRRSLRCETNLANVTVSSSFWTGSDGSPIEDCTLAVVNGSARDTFLRFPLSTSQPDGTHLVLPEQVLEAGRVHKSAGVLVFSRLVRSLLIPSRDINDTKQVNTPLLSYTLRGGASEAYLKHKLPNGTVVRLAFRHGATAKYPPVRTLRRWRNPGEEPSAVIGSALCTFLNIQRE